MCMAIVGKVIAIDGKDAIVDFTIAFKKAANIAQARLNDFVVVRGNLIIERLESYQGKKLFLHQSALVRKPRSKKFKA